MFRPISRKYDTAEHSYPKELDMLAAVIDGMNESGALGGAGAGGVGGSNGASPAKPDGNRNGSNIASLLGLIELCWGDVGLLLTMPRQGLGQAAIAAVADEEQLQRFGGKWAAMAITEPEAGSDSAAIRTTAALRRGERRIRPQRREDLRHLRRPRRADRGLGDARPRPGPRRDQVVRRRARQPGPEARPPRAQARDPRLRHRQLRARRLPGPEGEPARQPRDRDRARASPA